MKILLVAAVVACSIWIVDANAAAPAGDDEAGVQQALNYYLQGQATGNGEYYRMAFYPEAKLLFVRDDKLTSMTSEEFAAGAKGIPALDEAKRKRTIEMIDITGDVAVAKLVLDYPQVKFTDYMTLLKVDGRWRIINKSFYADRKAQPAR